MESELELIILEDWVLINVSGKDSENYLQTQLTTDVKKINNNQHILTAHCNSNGKMWSSLHLFRCKDGFNFIERRNLHQLQLSMLKKYAVFSDVIFTINNQAMLLGVIGLQARIALESIFNILPNEQNQMVYINDTYLLWFKYPVERFLLVTNSSITEKIKKIFFNKKKLCSARYWLGLNIEAGIPIIDKINSGKFVPQAVNLQELGGISFKKGCYIGQEIIVRIKHRGNNKHSMWCLFGYSNVIPEVGKNIEIKIKDKWCPIGVVLSSVQLEGNYLLIQIVMSNNVNSNSIFRIPGTNDILKVKSLPYVINK